MTPDISQWRSPDKYDYIEQLVSPELAWEWLRRNMSYQRDYADVLDAADDPEGALTHFLAGMDAKRRRQLRKLLERGRS